MIIVLPNDYKDVLSELDVGDCFELYGAYYMVTDGNGMGNPIMSVCCVDVITGELKVFMKNEKVKEVKLVAHFAEEEYAIGKSNSKETEKEYCSTKTV